ncbi:MAG TPA: 2Fe-2S iron-sulfur cluster-binding protein [Ramlibacter sp.]|nr:2Fe-2S iron-sulfur cluster-binding protein [Ramlibacter sp.]
MRTFEVLIEASGERFTAAEDETLLAAATGAGIAMPASCRNGTCRTCMRQLASGTVAYRIAWPGLLAEEKAEGWILPCVAYPRSALRITGAALRPWWESGEATGS